MTSQQELYLRTAVKRAMLSGYENRVSNTKILKLIKRVEEIESQFEIIKDLHYNAGRQDVINEISEILQSKKRK